MPLPEASLSASLFPILDHLPQGICIIQSDWRVVMWNACMEDWTGIRKEDIIGQPIGQRFSHLNEPQYASRLEMLFSGGPPVTFAPQFHPHLIPCSLPDGTPRFQRAIAKSIPIGEDEQDWYAMLVVEDVTPLTRQVRESHRLRQETLKEMEVRKEAEALLRTSEETFRTVVEAAPSGMVMIDESGVIVLANRLIAHQFGYANDELMGKPIEALIPERFRAQHPAHRATFIEEPRPRSMGAGRDLYGHRKDGTEFPVEIGLTPLVLKGERFVLATVVDITARKREEARLLQYMQDLHRSNQELDEFAYIASHDLKEPLRGIYNFSTILLEDYGQVLEEEGRRRCETLVRLSRRMEDLIESLLYFSRAGRTELAIGPTEMQEVVTGILDSLAIRLEESHVTIRIPRPLPTVQCDRVRVGEIFRNLITNAMKYNDKEEKWIEVGYEEAEPPPSGAQPAALLRVCVLRQRQRHRHPGKTPGQYLQDF